MISDILYNFEQIEEFRKSVKKSGNVPVKKIASGIRKFDKKRIPLYYLPSIAKDGETAEYHFKPVYLKETKEDGTAEEIETRIIIDEFIAAMWNHGIRFGLDMEGITRILGDGHTTHLTIAKNKEPVHGKSAELELLISFDVDHGIQDAENENGKIDMLMHRKAYVCIEKDAPLYRKKTKVGGEIGWTIHGVRIDPIRSFDFSIDSFMGVGVRKEIRDGVEYLVSNYSGFPRLEMEEHPRNIK